MPRDAHYPRRPDRDETMLEKTYQPAEVEGRIYETWERSGAFAAGRQGNARPFTIMIPPPNVTGSLHMGHALNNTLQDILVRYERMRGRDVLWQPGCDHAGIATQMVVERQLAEKKLTRHDLGREKFIERIWEWKNESGGTITGQLRRLGASCDWSRERFTMDDGLSQAVRKVFVALHKQGLIYKDKRLVNWDPKLHTAISDLEVEQRETKGRLWYFRYPVHGEDGRFVTVATTRPETMLGDTGIAVHPDDERYAALVGKSCIQPLTGRHLPIVADPYADPAKGSGAVKMTPAHDFNDFEVGRRHGLDLINIFDRDARLNDDVPEAYRGLDRFAARDRIVADMTALGLLEKIEDNQMTVPYGDRSGVVIEPWLTDQWFVDAAKLAGPAIEAVERGRTRFVPRNWENTYFEWMRNIQPWCISRQIWWGHQIPAWYAPDGRIFVELTAEEAQAAARADYGHDVDLVQDQDVLDTWFSSALWPFSTLGWPDDTAALKRYYPTDVLLTGFDIIFFWVARMMMMGLHFMGEVPFHTVYIHALVRDEHGQKMSKSRGNVLDPIGLFDTYGTDAVRFTLTALAVQGRDIKLSEGRIAGYRNFATKLWNAARYCLMNGCVPDPAFDPSRCELVVNQWLVGKVSAAVRSVDEALEAYRFNDAADAVYHFVWGTFCDWYLEFTKPVLTGTDADAIAETRGATAWALAQILKVLHPFMPYITEELWAKTAPEDQRTGLLVLESWPAPEALDWVEAQAEMDWLVSVIEKIRSVRSEMGIAPKARLTLHHLNASAATAERLARHRDLIARMAGVDDVRAATAPVAGAVQVVAEEATLMLPLAGVIDTGAERQRLSKELDRLQKEVAKLDAKLNNPAFVTKAPPEVIEEHRGRLAEGTQAAQKVSEALARLSSL